MKNFDPFNNRHMAGLRTSMQWSARKLEPHRKFRAKLIREYATPEYNDEIRDEHRRERDGTVYKTMFNAWQLAVDMILLRIAGGTPQIALATAFEELLPFSAEYEAVVNAELKKLKFGSIFREWVKESLFGLGVIHVCYRDQEIEEMMPGTPNKSQSVSAKVIDLDNFIADFRAKDWDECDYMGHKYRLEYDEVRQSELFYPEARAKVLPRRANNQQNMQDAAVEYANAIQSMWSLETELNDYVDVWDIWIPKAGIVVTFADGQDTPPLRVTDYSGPESGDYKILSMSKVPGHLMPITPGHTIKPLHDLFNSLLRKLEDQARNQKTVVAVNSGQEDDGRKLEEASNGSIISVQDTAGIKELNFNGPDGQNMALVPAIYDYLSRAAGNLDSMGGLGPQSNTVGQDQLISATVSERVASLAENVIESMTDVAKHIGWLIWNDQENSYFVQREIEGTGISIPVNMVPYDREGQFLDYNFQVIPYSIRYAAPSERSQTMMGLLTQIILPAMPFMQQQGINVRWQRVMESIAKYQSMPELNNMFEYGQPQEVGMGAGEIRKPPTSSRTYHRISSSAQQGSAKSILNQVSKSGGSQQPVVGG